MFFSLEKKLPCDANSLHMLCSINEQLKMQVEGEENSTCQKMLKVMAVSLVLMKNLLKPHTFAVVSYTVG